MREANFSQIIIIIRQLNQLEYSYANKIPNSLNNAADRAAAKNNTCSKMKKRNVQLAFASSGAL